MAEIDEIINEPSDSEKRIKQLSDKVRLTSEERDELKKLADEKDSKLVEKDRELSFANGYADVLSQHPDAKDFKEDIKSKVMAGMSVEDATFAVLGKAGKLGQQVDSAPIAGGSAATTMAQAPAEKSVNDMTQAERRAELENRPDLVDILAPRNNRI